MFTSLPITGIASNRSSPLPCGIPSTTSTRTRSAISRSASQCAVVAPVMPAPRIEILFMTPPEIYDYRCLMIHQTFRSFRLLVWCLMRHVVCYIEILSETQVGRKYILSLFILPDLEKKQWRLGRHCLNHYLLETSFMWM